MKTYINPETSLVTMTSGQILQSTSPIIPTPSYPGAPARESYSPRQESK
ncbi:MAG: hypothetical protein K5660_05355 [Paludibacteraceae bacterium]|nr:hypothetical protein [Paludibacteraceae bacterium]